MGPALPRRPLVGERKADGHLPPRRRAGSPEGARRSDHGRFRVTDASLLSRSPQESLCRWLCRPFREPLRHTAAPPLSPSTPRPVQAWRVRSARMAPALQCLELLSAPSDLWWTRVACLSRLARYHPANRRWGGAPHNPPRPPRPPRRPPCPPPPPRRQLHPPGHPRRPTQIPRAVRQSAARKPNFSE